MSDNNANKTEHPIELRYSLVVLGATTSLFLFVATAFSIFLVLNSARMFNELAYNVVLLIGIIYLISMVWGIRLNKKYELRVYRKKITLFDVMLVSLLLCGFVQTVLWVFDSETSIHEPRSVLILAVASVIGFFKRQIEAFMNPAE